MAKKTAASLGDLSSRALCVDVTFSWWNARAVDRKVSKEVTDRHKVSTNAGKWDKQLFPFERPEYDELHTKINEAAKYVDTHTVPWSYGVRLLKASFLGEFNGKLKEYAEEIETLKKSFFKVYPSYVQTASERLNGMFHKEDYPDIASVKSKFGMHVRYFPVVAPGDFRLEVDESLMKELKELHAAEFTDIQAEMSKKLWTRIYKAVERAAKLANKDTKVFESVFTDLDELADILPSLNMLDDPDLDRMAKDLKTQLAGRDASIVRGDDKERADVAAKAQALADKMARFMN